MSARTKSHKHQKVKASTHRSMIKSQSQSDIPPTDAKHQDILKTPPPIPIHIGSQQVHQQERAAFESPICFADLLNQHTNGINEFDQQNENSKQIDLVLKQFRDSLMTTINGNETQMQDKFDNERETIINEYETIIKQKNEEIEMLRDKLTDISFECHEMTTKQETLQTQYNECRKKLESTKEASQALSKWRIESEKKRFTNAFTENIIIPHRNKMAKKKIFLEWKLEMYEQLHQKYDKIWEKRLETLSSKIVNEYEITLNQLRNELKNTQNQCHILQKERNDNEKDMKRAFMRGVSALNLEAMSLFRKSMTQSTIEMRSEIEKENELKHDDIVENNEDQPRSNVPDRFLKNEM